MKKRVLFLDRDGTIIVEPKADQQVDSLEKLDFIPGAISALRNICALQQFELVLVSNQDGLGTSSFPEDSFWPPHLKMIDILAGENVIFSEEHIDRSFPSDRAETRKPGTGMLKKYFSEDYDLANSYVIGDRLTDVELAQNLGAEAILFGGLESDAAALSTCSWDSIYRFLRAAQRKVVLRRTTSETDILLELSLDGSGSQQIQTGLGFFDHMLSQIARHSGCDLRIEVDGDLYVDEHHTIEDTGLVLGEAVRRALGDKRGISRYGFLLPMDDCLAKVAIDFSGRPWFIWDAVFRRERIGEMPCEMFPHFFKSFSDAAACTLHIAAEGTNEHHKIEAIFKGFARALRHAWRIDMDDFEVPSTKGEL